MVHVHGHMDKHLRQDQLTPLQKVNIRADELASSALMEALATQTFIKDLFPSKGVIVAIGIKCITGSPKAEITHLCYARAFPLAGDCAYKQFPAGLLGRDG